VEIFIHLADDREEFVGLLEEIVWLLTVVFGLIAIEILETGDRGATRNSGNLLTWKHQSSPLVS
jgi:hypothetical protein